MRILVTGSTGLVGTAVVERLQEEGFEISRLVRTKWGMDEPEIVWAPDRGEIDVEALEGFDGVVHLAGENISTGRWTEEKKQRIYSSRVEGTRRLCETFTQLDCPPKVLISASAIGYYGDRGVEILDEDSASGNSFLARVCRDWESATASAEAHGIRVVKLRIGMVLSAKGGALEKMLLPFKLGMGGVIGGGGAYMSWVAIDDLVDMVLFCLTTEQMRGPVNALSPRPVTNREFTKALGRVLSRPTLFPMPAFAVRLAFGEMGQELLLASARAIPKRLDASGFKFQYPDVEQALRHVLGL
jgi:uncharacterized protein